MPESDVSAIPPEPDPPGHAETIFHRNDRIGLSAVGGGALFLVLFVVSVHWLVVTSGAAAYLVLVARWVRSAPRAARRSDEST